MRLAGRLMGASVCDVGPTEAPSFVAAGAVFTSDDGGTARPAAAAVVVDVTDTVGTDAAADKGLRVPVAASAVPVAAGAADDFDASDNFDASDDAVVVEAAAAAAAFAAAAAAITAVGPTGPLPGAVLVFLAEKCLLMRSMRSCRRIFSSPIFCLLLPPPPFAIAPAGLSSDDVAEPVLPLLLPMASTVAELFLVFAPPVLLPAVEWPPPIVARLQADVDSVVEGMVTPLLGLLLEHVSPPVEHASVLTVVAGDTLVTSGLVSCLSMEVSGLSGEDTDK